MTLFVSAVGLALTDFTAYELPTNKWMKLIRPKMRLRVRTQHCESVSSSVKVYRSQDGTNFSSAHWPWNNDDRPFLFNEEEFEIEVERRFLLRYKCIRRTKSTTINRIRDGDHQYVLSLYDGKMSAEMLEDGNRPKIGDITFRLQSDTSREDTWSTGKASAWTFLEEVTLHEHGQSRRGMFWQT